MAENITYSDIDLEFTQTSEGNIGVLTGLDSIRQSIKNIILSPIKSRSKYQDPEFGCGVFDLLMEKMSGTIALILQEHIENALNDFEPRIEVIEISVNENAQANAYEILIKYRVLALDIEDDLTLDLEILK